MTCKKGTCSECGYWDNQGRRSILCHRFPTSVATTAEYWCGEFVPRTEEEQKVVENKLESKKARAARAEAMDAARLSKAKEDSNKTVETVPVEEPMAVAEQPQSTQ